jgi:hypothetical protein
MGAINPSKFGTFDTNYFFNFLKGCKFQNLLFLFKLQFFCEGKILNFEKIPFFEKKISKKLIN